MDSLLSHNHDSGLLNRNVTDKLLEEEEKKWSFLEYTKHRHFVSVNSKKH